MNDQPEPITPDFNTQSQAPVPAPAPNPVMTPPQMPVTPAPSTGGKSKRLAIIATVIVVVIAAAGASYIATKDDASSTNADGSELLSSSELKPYTSAQHNFTASFPGFPQQDSSTIEAEGYSIPYTMYSSNKLGGDKVSVVAVYDYTVITGEFNTHAALEGAVNGAVQNTPGGVLVSSEYTTFDGYEAITGYYTAPLDSGKQGDIYLFVVSKGKTFYALITTGESKAEFDAFMDSFSFTD